MKTTPKDGRTPQQALSYAVGHRIRFEVLALLNESIRTPDELARLIRQPLGKVTHHINALAASGAIELARTEPVRNTTRHFYRAIKIPYLSDEETRALPPETRREIIRLILQAIMAESLASFSAGRMDDDDDIWLSWRWFNLDAEGRREIADEQAESWERIQAIEARSAARRAESGGDPVSIIVSSLGYVRNRTSPKPPITFREN
jgi:DNA-binding transcriptional ArsR family regulator